MVLCAVSAPVHAWNGVTQARWCVLAGGLAYRGDIGAIVDMGVAAVCSGAYLYGPVLWMFMVYLYEYLYDT